MATALVLLAVVIVSYLLGVGAFFVLISVLVAMALFEVVDGLGQGGHRLVLAFVLACGAAMLVAAFARRLELVVVVLAVAASGSWLLALRPGRGASAATDAAWSVMAIAWIGGGGTAAVAIMMLEPSGLLLLIAFLASAAMDDIGAYFVGTRFGRRKLAPSLSPAKSWEGFFGGMVAALATGTGFGALIDDLGPLHGLVIGAVCSLLGPVGDLVESVFKREVGVKDSGRLLPGHGGVLDRLDAIVFCAPAVFLYLRFVGF